MDIKSFSYTDYSKGDTIVIYGATIGGRVILQRLNELGIEVAFFFDRQKYDTSFFGVNVKHPDELLDYPTAKIIIALTRSFNSAIQYLSEKNIQLAYECVNLLTDYKCEDNDYQIFNFLKQYPLYVKDINPESIKLPALELFITEKCTLCCEHCSHLIPFYSEPKHHDLDTLMYGMKRILQVVDHIHELYILGGEPFLHPQINDIINFLSAQSKISVITVITNASVLPNDSVFETIKNAHVRVRISDYGKLSRNLNELIDKLKIMDIPHYINNEKWVDLGKIEKHDYSTKDIHYLFADCPFSYASLMLSNRFYRCAHTAHMHNLGLIDDNPDDYIDFYSPDYDFDDYRQRMINYMNLSKLYGCYYCNGIKDNVNIIDPATQMTRRIISEIC